MTHNESFAQALKLKDFVSLHDDKAWICFTFTSDINFDIKIFDQEPDDDIKIQLQYDSVHVNKMPMARLAWCEFAETKVFTYSDLNFLLHIDLNSGAIMYFESRDCASLDLSILRNDARKSYSQLIAKLK
ncbi:hypothetical protein CIK05_13600 [Bdellovibrio sp. qaytius]|nr:hypothetical protein CIK05_13600 [Bdellovibrio sp. qaytius]